MICKVCGRTSDCKANPSYCKKHWEERNLKKNSIKVEFETVNYLLENRVNSNDLL